MDRRYIRPEDRRRSGSSGDGAEWVDTVPACFRSEAFAEDLAPGPALAAASAPVLPAAARRTPRARGGLPWFGRVAYALRGGTIG